MAIYLWDILCYLSIYPQVNGRKRNHKPADGATCVL